MAAHGPAVREKDASLEWLCSAADLGAVLVEAHGATEACVLVQGGETFGQVSPPQKVTARDLLRDYHVLISRVAPHDLVHCLGSG